MPTVTVAPIVLRTTTEPSTAYPHGIVLGTGATPDAALEDLATEAERHAVRIADAVAAAENRLPDASWGFHVADVRLTAGPGPQPWVASGTLVTPAAEPWTVT